MGARTLEAGLRLRLLGWLGPLLVVVGGVLLTTTYRAFVELQARAATERAASALRMLEGEMSEGGDLDSAMHEVTQAADADRIPILLRHSEAPPLERMGLQPLPTELAGLSAGACASATSDDGTAWLACAQRDRDVAVVVGLPMGPMREQLRRLGTALAALIVLALAGAAFVARSAIRRSIQQVGDLAAWSRGLSASAPPTPAPRGASLEVGQLADAFDGVVRRLYEALDRERAQSAHIAHELRNPLTALRAEIETLSQRGDAAASRALVDADRLRDVIDAILVLAAGSREARDVGTTVNLADLARELAPRDAVVEAPDEALVSGDPRLLQLALRNLVDNARRHGGGARTVRVVREGEGVAVQVVDAGPGVPADQMDRVFERYWRGTADGEGSGLGLALVRAVAERHGGRATVQGGVPRGLVAGFFLPRVVEWSES
jgi:signal transduction histidine kinase